MGKPLLEALSLRASHAPSVRPPEAVRSVSRVLLPASREAACAFLCACPFQAHVLFFCDRAALRASAWLFRAAGSQSGTDLAELDHTSHAHSPFRVTTPPHPCLFCLYTRPSFV